MRDVVEQEPELYQIAYSLGLLLAEMKKYKDAESYLSKAAAGMAYGRAHYNHGQVLLVLNQPGKAEKALLAALSLEPQEQEFFVALVDYYLKSGQPEKARILATDIVNQFPGHSAARELLQYLAK